MEKNNGKTLDSTDLLLSDIEVLKEYRNIMWSNQEKTSFLAYQHFQELPELLEKRL